MFTFRRFTLIFFICLLGLNLGSIFGCGSVPCFFCVHLPWFYAGLLTVYFGVSIAMAFVPSSGFHYPVTSRGNTVEKQVALTFDDGPDPSKTPALLDVLRSSQAPASFFLVGRRIEANEALVKRIAEEGHILGIHSWSHSKWFDFFTPAMMKRELVRSTEALTGVTGRTPRLFRLPYGVINPMLARALRKLPLVVIGWSIRSLDTVTKDPDKVLDRIVDRLHPGGIILLHDHSIFTSEHIEILIRKIGEAGYTIVPLDRLLNIKAYAD